jgi:hypothetical protein
MMAIHALNVMKEGHDGSGIGLLMADLGGDFQNFKGLPILSGIFCEDGIVVLDRFMSEQGFPVRYEMSIHPSEDPPPGTPKRDFYLIRVYDYPESWNDISIAEKGDRLMQTRVALRKRGEVDNCMILFSFWPDVIMIKEVGDPLTISSYLHLDRPDLQARIMLAQGRQNTNYAINIYACHPFFIEGISTMTNGENTAFVPIREFLTSRNCVGYSGYQSDSEVFTHILHYSMNHLKLGVDMYKHIITPLKDEELTQHPDGRWLKLLKQSCRPLIVDGPNCVMGCLPDRTLFMVQDSKKLRPGIVGGKSGLFVFSSEMCGLDAAVPDRNKHDDFQPMKYDTVAVGPDRQEVKRWNQWEPLHHPH